MTKMRAKMQVTCIEVSSNPEGVTTGERLHFRAVANCPYPEDGSDENNTYAKFSPDAHLSIYVANPALFGQFKAGEAYYVDFTAAP